MKQLILISSLILGGCGATLNSNYLNVAADKCGGYDKISHLKHPDIWYPSSFRVFCADGARHTFSKYGSNSDD